MNPEWIYLRNVRTFDEVHLGLPEGLLAVIGANGAGKSTLISAIDVALFGPDGRSLQSWYPRGDGADPLSIELVFEHAGSRYRARRSFSPKGRGQSKLDFDHCLSLNGPAGPVWEPLTLESQTATQELIEATIGLSRTTFRASSYLAQGDTGAFCDAQPRDRKAILSEIIGLAEWDRWLERAREEKRACENEIAQHGALLEQASTELTKRTELEAQAAAAAGQETNLKGQLEETTTLHAAARERLATVLQAAERRAAAQRDLNAASAMLAQLRERITAREAEIVALDKRLESKPVLFKTADRLVALEAEKQLLDVAAATAEKLQQLDGKRTSLEQLAIEQQEEAIRCQEAATRVLEGVGQEHCDRCGQTLGEEAAQRAAESYRADAAVAEQRSGEVMDEIETVKQQINDMPAVTDDPTRLEEVLVEIDQARDAKTQLATLSEVASRKESAEQDLARMWSELPAREEAEQTARSELSGLGEADSQGEQEEAEVQRLDRLEFTLRAGLEQAVRHSARWTERLERLAESERQAEDAKAKLAPLAERRGLLTVMERACGQNGVPALILENVAIPQIEAEASRILSVLGGPATNVALHTQRETKTGGISDTLDIVLTTETGEAPYESFSGGERARIAFALRLALAQLLAGRKGADTGLLVIDEVEGLDAEGISALVGVLEELQRSIARIVVVSHQIELRDAFPQALTVEKVDGSSRVVSTQP